MNISRNKEVLGLLLKSIKNRDGEERVRQIQESVKKSVYSAMDREVICQVLSFERPGRRFMFFVLCPQYIFPYLFRMKEKKQVVSKTS